MIFSCRGTWCRIPTLDQGHAPGRAILNLRTACSAIAHLNGFSALGANAVTLDLSVHRRPGKPEILGRLGDRAAAAFQGRNNRVPLDDLEAGEPERAVLGTG